MLTLHIEELVILLAEQEELEPGTYKLAEPRASSENAGRCHYRERGSWKESLLTGGKWGFRVVTVSPGLSGRAGKTFLLLSSEGMWAGEVCPFRSGGTDEH